MRIYYNLYVVLASILAILLSLMLTATRCYGGDFCYRPNTVKVVTHSYPTYGYANNYGRYDYYVKEYVPYAVEVQVYKDRYYSLSDLYRDRLYLEAFDLLKQMKEKLDNGGHDGGTGGSNPDPQPMSNPTGTPPASPKVPQGKAGQLPKTTAAVKTLLTGSCASCHQAANGRLDLSDPDKVDPVHRWASFGMMATRDMPKAPASLLEKGKEKELDDWRSKNALTDEQLKAVYDGWVKPALAATAKK